MSEYYEGYNAYCDGDSVESNPYEYESAEWNLWIDGYYQAAEDE